MVGTLGYKWLIRLADEQLEQRQRTLLLTPLKGMDEVLEQEYKKGEVAGILLFKEIVDIRIGVLKQEIDEYFEEKGDEHRDEQDRDGEREYGSGADELSFGEDRAP
ncbi:MAG: hypothetical protein DA330_00920 [Nitrososphaera sp.]|nr:hypothetical protein [Nitrososphaera sp.]